MDIATEMKLFLSKNQSRNFPYKMHFVQKKKLYVILYPIVIYVYLGQKIRCQRVKIENVCQLDVTLPV